MKLEPQTSSVDSLASRLYIDCQTRFFREVTLSTDKALSSFTGRLFVGIPSVGLNAQDAGVEAAEVQADHVRN